MNTNIKKIIGGSTVALGLAGIVFAGISIDTPVIKEIPQQEMSAEVIKNISKPLTAKDRILEISNVVNEATTKVAVIKDGKVVNTVKVSSGWTGKKGEWQPPEGTQTILSKTAGIGDIYEDGKFYRIQRAPKEKPNIEDLAKKKILTNEEKDILIKYLLEEQLKK